MGTVDNQSCSYPIVKRFLAHRHKFHSIATYHAKKGKERIYFYLGWHKNCFGVQGAKPIALTWKKSKQFVCQVPKAISVPRSWHGTWISL
jgi:hypothetical protein